MKKTGEEGDDSCLPVFITKLLRMLSSNTNPESIRWGADGTTVLISDPSAFATKVIPKYFKHSNFASFVRQLNLYGFHKTTQDPEVCEFQHKYFKRDQPSLLHNIKRKVALEKSDNARSKVDMDDLVNSVNEVKSRQTQFENALLQKEMEKQILYQEVMNAQQKQKVLEEKISRLAWVLMKACNAIQEQQRTTQTPQPPQQIQQGNSQQPPQQMSAPSPSITSIASQGMGMVGIKRNRDDDGMFPPSQRQYDQGRPPAAQNPSATSIGMNTMGGLSMNDERKQLQSIDPSNLEDWLSQLASIGSTLGGTGMGSIGNNLGSTSNLGSMGNSMQSGGLDPMARQGNITGIGNNQQHVANNNNNNNSGGGWQGMQTHQHHPNNQMHSGMDMMHSNDSMQYSAQQAAACGSFQGILSPLSSVNGTMGSIFSGSATEMSSLKSLSSVNGTFNSIFGSQSDTLGRNQNAMAPDSGQQSQFNQQGQVSSIPFLPKTGPQGGGGMNNFGYQVPMNLQQNQGSMTPQGRQDVPTDDKKQQELLRMMMEQQQQQHPQQPYR